MCLVKKFDQNFYICGVENEVLLKLVKYFEMSLLESRESKQFCFEYLSIAKNMSNPIHFTEFR